MTPLLVILSFISLLPAQPDRFGTPACSAPGQELADRTYFVLCHSGSTRTPIWVAYELKPHHLAAIAPRPTHFRRDPELVLPTASDSDYRHSGFHRGHLAAAADFAWDDQAIRATFLLSNAVPQYPSANRRSARVEAVIRRLASTSQAVWIFTGPIYSAEPHTIGPNRVAVPSHTFKVVLALHNDNLAMYAVIIPNTADPRDPYLTTVDEVERRSGLDFFNLLDDDLENHLESRAEPLFPHY